MSMFTKTTLVGLTAAALVAAGGSAFTASNTVNGDNYAGYGSATVTGATSTGIEHTLSADGTTINSTLITFSTDIVAGHNVKAGFGTTNLETCTADVTANTATCTYATGYTTSSANDFRVAVS
jgi:hypothetical protein